MFSDFFKSTSERHNLNISQDFEIMETSSSKSNEVILLNEPKDKSIDSKNSLQSKSQEDGLEPENLNVKSCNGSIDDHQHIMTACSNVGQNIRQSIAETLKSRIQDEQCSSNESDSLLPSAMIVNFEDALKENLTTKAVAFDTTLEQCSKHLEEITIPDKPQPVNSDLCPDKDSLAEPADSSTEVISHLENGNSLNVYDLLVQHIREGITETLSSQNAEKVHFSEENFASILEVSIMKKLKESNLSSYEKWTKPIDKEEEESSDVHKEEEAEVKSESPSNVEEKEIINDNEKSSKKTHKSSTNKKKGEKTIGFFTNQITKFLSGLPTAEEKVVVLSRRHAETLEKVKATEIQTRQSERQIIQLSREKEQLQADHNRNILAKSRLESLCRELQRQNKAIKEESLLRIREEEEKRKEVASKFQTTLSDIGNLMQENSKKNQQLKEENGELAQKLKTLVEHYEMWEKHMEKVVQQKDLEAQLAIVKQAKTNLQLKQETENFLKEKQTLLENMSELQKKCTQLATNELQLRAELGDYTSKYEEFQTVLNKSNQVFASFKTDMDSTTKKIKKLEKETNIWKHKWEGSNKALVEMITDKQIRDKELLNSQQRVLTLEKLCRALQAERNALQSQIKKTVVPDNEVVQPEVPAVEIS